MPDYELVLWDKNRFDISSVEFVKEACQMYKWAFAADYIRLYALYKEGGIYLDSDVFIRNRLDCFLHHLAFSCVEFHPGIAFKHGSESLLNFDGTPRKRGTIIPGIGIQAAVLGGVKGHSFFKSCMASYQNRRFILKSGKTNSNQIAPSIYAMVAEDFGFVYKDRKQDLKEGLVVYPSETFAGHLNQATRASFAMHLCAGSWRPPRQHGFFKKATKRLKKCKALRILVKKRPIETNIKYRMASPGMVSIDMFSEGEFLLESISLGKQEKGKHELNWQCKELPAGRYICRIKNNDQIIREFYFLKRPITE